MLSMIIFYFDVKIDNDSKAASDFYFAKPESKNSYVAQNGHMAAVNQNLW